MKRGRKYREALSKLRTAEIHSLEDAVKLLKEASYARFDESVEMSINLNVLQKHTIRDTVTLPHGTGKKARILVFAKADKAGEAQEAGADYVGEAELIDQVKKGWFDFDVAVATPDMMKEVGKIGQILGPRGLMPNPKAGTVTNNIKETVEELKKGRVEFRADKTGIIHLGVGKISMDPYSIAENCRTLYEEVLHKRPADLKGEYIRSVYLSSTMSPGVRIDHKQIA